jgi:hypothetical protein
MDLGVVLRRRPGAGSWGQETWEVAALVPPAEAAAGSALNPSGGLIYGGAFPVVLHRGETAAYRDNLASEHPMVWVAMAEDATETPTIRAVTVHPGEGEALAGDVGLVVEAVPMPRDMMAAIAEFVATFHVARPFVKRSRTKEISG